MLLDLPRVLTELSLQREVKVLVLRNLLHVFDCLRGSTCGFLDLRQEVLLQEHGVLLQRSLDGGKAVFTLLLERQAYTVLELLEFMAHCIEVTLELV